MLRKLFLFLFLALCLIAAPAVALAQTVNMFAGIKRGGFGDIASNFLMAEKLKELSPELNINMWVSTDILEYVKTLVPEFDPSKGVQQINGIKFYYGDANPLPQADFFLGYSLNDKNEVQSGQYAPGLYIPGVDDKLVNAYETIYRIANAKNIVHFKEYQGSNYELASITNVASGQRLFSFETGPLAGGLYISPSKPTQAPSKQEALNLLRAEGYELPVVTEGKVRLAYSYSAYPNIAKVYLEAMQLHASRFPNEQFVIVAKDFPVLRDMALPANLHVVWLDKKTPFELNKALIAASDAPILVTGDVSLTVAIEHEKLFIYETNTWKRKSMTALRKKLVDASEYFKDPAHEAKLRSVFEIPGRLHPKEFSSTAKKIADAFADAEFRAELTASLAAARSTMSLPAFTLDFLESAAEMARSGGSVHKSPKDSVLEFLASRGMRVQPTLFHKLGQKLGAFCERLLTKAKAIF